MEDVHLFHVKFLETCGIAVNLIQKKKEWLNKIKSIFVKRKIMSKQAIVFENFY